MEDYFKSAIAYYFKYLVDNGYNDPIKVIVSDFLDTVKMTDDQREYIKSNTKDKIEVVDDSSSIDFVNDSISVVTKFKGNSRNANKIFHSKYQILSMISTTFKEMYANS